MQIIATEYKGLCPSVERAVAIALKAREETSSNHKVATLGRIAHNDFVQRRLTEAGIGCVDSPESLSAGDVLVISAHGAPKSVYSECRKLGILVRDATCPNIVKIHEKIDFYSNSDYFVLVIGDPTHREVAADIS